MEYETGKMIDRQLARVSLGCLWRLLWQFKCFTREINKETDIDSDRVLVTER